MSSSSDESETSNSESNNQHLKVDSEKIAEPEGDVKVMIDKLAEYVARNGLEFEENILSRNDKRFDFIKEGCEFNRYYRNQIDNLKLKVHLIH